MKAAKAKAEKQSSSTDTQTDAVEAVSGTPSVALTQTQPYASVPMSQAGTATTSQATMSPALIETQVQAAGAVMSQNAATSQQHASQMLHSDNRCALLFVLWVVTRHRCILPYRHLAVIWGCTVSAYVLCGLHI